MKGVYVSMQENQLLGGLPLPPPLSKQEEEALLKNFTEQSRRMLQERNLRLVLYIAKKFSNTSYSIDDLFATGCIGLLKATNTFNCEKNIKFATYASRCIENEILMSLRHEKKWDKDISLTQPLATDLDGNELLAEDICEDSKSNLAFESLEFREMLSQVLTWSFCYFDQRKALILCYTMSGKKQREIGKFLNISQSYVSRLQKKIRSELKSRKDFNVLKEQQKLIVSFEEDFVWLKFSKADFPSIEKICKNFNFNYEDTTYYTIVQISFYDDEMFDLIAEVLKYN